MNSVNITGRMTREPDIRYATGNNTTVAKFCIAVNRRFKQDGQPSADYINCTAFGKLAEFVENEQQRKMLEDAGVPTSIRFPSSS